MKILSIVMHFAPIVAVMLLAGCSKKITTEPVHDSGAWFIESWDNGIITAQYQHNRYKAKCDISRSFNNAKSVTDEKNVHMFSACDLGLTFVGRTVQPFEGKQRDAEGRIVTMWSVGNTLALRSWKDDQTPWRQEEYVVTSVTPITR